MTTTVKDVIKAELLRVCLETTAKFRTKHEKKEKKEKYSTEEVQKVRDTYKSIGWNEDQISKQMEALSILHDAPELKKPTIPAMELFCVVVCEKDASGHGYGKKPVLWTMKRDPNSGYFWDHAGSLGSHSMNYTGDAVRFATDEEIKSCIGSLTDKQWKSVLANDLFIPIIDATMSKDVQVDDAPAEEEKDNGEITVYGRAITVTDE